MSNPVLVEVVRGDAVESRHRGAAVVVDAAGDVEMAWGDSGCPVFPRSAVKPLQALPLIESGAADHFGLGDGEIALACASHAGESEHVRRVEAWLTRIGLTMDDLECGAHPPSNPDAAHALVRAGLAPCPLHNNCSGKHAGFLTTAVHIGAPTKGYIGRDHPVQQAVAEALGRMCGLDMRDMVWAVDGCGIPTFAIPLWATAAGMARLAADEGGAARRIRAAMAANPYLVAGSGRLCTEIMRAQPGLLLKGGAEGVYTAMVPDRGLGVALKIDDGAGRAAEVAVLAVLDRLGLLQPTPRLNPPVVDVAGKVVGEIRAVF